MTERTDSGKVNLIKVNSLIEQPESRLVSASASVETYLNDPVLDPNQIKPFQTNVPNATASTVIELDKLINRSITLTWKNLFAYLPTKSKFCCNKKKNLNDSPKVLINSAATDVTSHMDESDGGRTRDLNGIAKPKEILAIMGASGAGKTTLLNALNFRNRGNLLIHGEIKTNGRPIKSIQDIASISGYVQQDDLFIGYLTVKEHLIFQAMLRMEKGTKKEQRLKRVDEVIYELNLQKCQDTIIGLFGRKGISGGEKRRLAFASEIITDPSILFCDEPTSGLDSFMAYSVAECMKSLAKKGKTIVCTIHQPSSELFEMFDNLCLLAEGRLAYLGNPYGANQFFSRQGFTLPPNYNPADFYIKKLAIMPSDKDNCLQTVNKLCNGFNQSEQFKDMLNEIDSVNQRLLKNNKNDLFFKEKTFYKTNGFTQMGWLLWRNMMGMIREPFLFKVQIIQTIIVAVMFGLIYLRLKYDQKGVMDINGFLFLCISNNGFSTLFLVVNIFPLELPIFIREHQNGMYRVLVYYLSKFFIDTPNFILLPVIFMSICYWMANLNNDVTRFFICLGIIILVVQCSCAFGTFLSAAAPSTNIALAMAGPVLVPLMIFSGYLLNYDSIPKYFIWLRYLSWFGYANENILINQWKGVTNLDCDLNTTFQCFESGEQVIAYLKLNEDNFAMNIILMFVLIVFYRTLAFLIMVLKSRQR